MHFYVKETVSTPTSFTHAFLKSWNMILSFDEIYEKYQAALIT